MSITLHKSTIHSRNNRIEITGSKSETNRLLILQALYPDLVIENLSNSDDSKIMREALSSDANIIDVGHAGTAMRFLTAYYAIQDGREIILTGSSRMQQRPIQILVDALTELGADISFLKKEGFPPLKIKGVSISNNQVDIDANISSQYISALLLIAPKLKNGLNLKLNHKISSRPYIDMTLALLQQMGCDCSIEDHVVSVHALPEIIAKEIVVESDWSSSSYFYSIIALSPIDSEITLLNYKHESLQGDAIVAKIYEQFGVQTVFNWDKSITLKKVTLCTMEHFEYQLHDFPDLAQTIGVTCLGLGLSCKLLGLQSLKIKETDRLIALKTEIEKFGSQVNITNNSLEFKATIGLNRNVKVSTYDDHRMAMSFAALALKVPIIIEDESVVSKSYPRFWDDLISVGFNIFQ